MTKLDRQPTGLMRIGRHFHQRYRALCRVKNIRPVPEICSNRKRDSSSVDFFGDRLKECDWYLIEQSLVEDISLELLAIRMRKLCANEKGANLSLDGRSERPPIFNKSRLPKLIESVTKFLEVNNKLKSLTLEALPIKGVLIATLMNGLKHSTTLTDLSFARCAIADEGCETVCTTVKSMPKIVTLNLSDCSLTAIGCHFIVDLIKFQKIQRFANCWQQSLRYREIKEEQLDGVKFLLLNNNPAIGDEGLLELTEVLKEDFWIRQIHFQNCGITEQGTSSLVACLKMNKSIEKFDVRHNVKISIETARKMFNVEAGVAKEQDSKKTVDLTSITHQLKLYEQQLSAERNRNNQLESIVEQLHLQLKKSTTEICTLKEQYHAIMNERNDLLQHIDVHRAEGKTFVHKSKSEFLPRAMVPSTGVRTAAKSEVHVRRGANDDDTKVCVLERTIGDVGNDTLTEKAGAIRASFVEGRGDAPTAWRRITPGCSSNYTAKPQPCKAGGDADSPKLSALHKKENNHRDDEAIYPPIQDEVSCSGIDLLKLIAKKRHNNVIRNNSVE